MKFIVSFESTNHLFRSPITGDIGIKELDLIRTETGCNLPHSRVNSLAKAGWAYNRTLDLEIDEALARKSGQFENHLIFGVKVTGLLPIERKIELERDPETDEIVSATIAYYPDHPAILKLWEENGFSSELVTVKPGKQICGEGGSHPYLGDTSTFTVGDSIKLK